MVNHELLFHKHRAALDLQLHLLQFGQRHDAGIAHQDIQRPVEPGNHVSACSDGRHTRQLADQRRDGGGRKFSEHLLTSGCGFLHRAASAEHMGAAGSQRAHRFIAKARVATGYQGRHAAQVIGCRNFVRRGGKAELTSRDVGKPDARTRHRGL